MEPTYFDFCYTLVTFGREVDRPEDTAQYRKDIQKQKAVVNALKQKVYSLFNLIHFQIEKRSCN